MMETAEEEQKKKKKERNTRRVRCGSSAVAVRHPCNTTRKRRGDLFRLSMPIASILYPDYHFCLSL